VTGAPATPRDGLSPRSGFLGSRTVEGLRLDLGGRILAYVGASWSVPCARRRIPGRVRIRRSGRGSARRRAGRAACGTERPAGTRPSPLSPCSRASRRAARPPRGVYPSGVHATHASPATKRRRSPRRARVPGADGLGHRKRRAEAVRRAKGRPPDNGRVTDELRRSLAVRVSKRQTRSWCRRRRGAGEKRKAANRLVRSSIAILLRT